MKLGISEEKLAWLSRQLSGELHYSYALRAIYATDASMYREIPLAVAYPKDEQDIKVLIDFARQNNSSLIPRAAGTSLAGQCVGKGIVVDISRYFTKVLEINQKERWVRVQPGVVRDELNLQLKPYGLFFGPNTSTANRAMIGGMVGNNSCGSYSIVYGTTRDHVLELKTILSDGSEATFKKLSVDEFHQKCMLQNLEGKIYRQIRDELSDAETRDEILREFPKPEIHRRNTGYALDLLMQMAPFVEGGEDFNMCKLLSGSEGTLAFITEITLHLDELPPSHTVLVCAHFRDIEESMRATLTAMRHRPRAVELMDRIILECTKEHIEYRNARFFVEGDPGAILIIEFGASSKEEATKMAITLIDDMKHAGYGYAFPIVSGPDIRRVWDVRAAGLGLLSNVKGKKKPVAVIEDTAVALEELPSYIAEFSAMMSQFGQTPVYYAHAGAGELHIRPILDLKDPNDRKLLREMAQASALLVKKYRGSLSGEHGDGRVRAEFIPLLVGVKNYQLFRRIKYCWDPQNIFNPGKIVDAPPMDASLRYDDGQVDHTPPTMFDFHEGEGLLAAVERCNGSADCRKSHLSGGTMCPSYMATKNEKDTTRARANLLRECLSRSQQPHWFDNKELYDVLDLCLSCKGCKSECPSNVDMAMLKAEVLYHYYSVHAPPIGVRVMAHIGRYAQWASHLAVFSNGLLKNKLTSTLIKSLLRLHSKRSFPLLHPFSLRSWFKKNHRQLQPNHKPLAKVYLFCDEFTNYYDVEAGIKSIRLLTRLGYQVELPDHAESGRSYFSKGFLKEAKMVAEHNVRLLGPMVSEQTPLIGIEPSAILSFRDEYPAIVQKKLRDVARCLSPHVYTLEEFLFREKKKGHVAAQQFTSEIRHILLHEHCHQKALSRTECAVSVLSLPENYHVQVIPSGCCGMAGSFGYEKEHYDLSMQIGELVLFPAIRQADSHVVIAASGTSCRHQIWDGTGRKALHPAEILHDALVI